MIRLDLSHLGARVGLDDLARAGAGREALLAACQAGERGDRASLGWLRTSVWADDAHLGQIEALAARLRGLADTFVLIGVGGSNNAARAVLGALGARDGSLDGGAHRVVWAGNTLSAFQLNRVLEDLEGHEVAIDCVAKNFQTLEPGSSFRLLRQRLVARHGEREAARRIVCCGTPGSSLEDLSREQGYEFLPFPPDVGGRYTALTGVHLLALAFAGADVRALVAGARDEERELLSAPAGSNMAWDYACARKAAWDAGLRVELLGLFEPRLAGFGKWFEQLFAESEGKDGLGLLPCSAEYSEELHSLGQYVQDGTPQLMETFVEVLGRGEGDSLPCGPTDVDDGFGYLDGLDFWDVNRASFEATRDAHAQRLPVLSVQLDRLCEEDLGRLLYFEMLSCYLSAELLGVDPFDQPGVEAYKRRMFAALGAAH